MRMIMSDHLRPTGPFLPQGMKQQGRVQLEESGGIGMHVDGRPDGKNPVGITEQEAADLLPRTGRMAADFGQQGT